MDYRWNIGPPWDRYALHFNDEGLFSIFEAFFGNRKDLRQPVSRTADIYLTIDYSGDTKNGEKTDYRHLLDVNRYITEGIGWAGYYDFNNNKGELTFTRDNYIAVDTYLRQILLYKSLIMGYLPLHSVAFAYNGKTFICPGESGSGKSTIANFISAKADVFSDEINVIGGKPYRVWALPFRGSSRNDISAGGGELISILLHKKAPDTYLSAVSRKEALREIEKSVILPLFDVQNIEVKTFELLTRIIAETDIKVINFIKEADSFLNVVGSI